MSTLPASSPPDAPPKEQKERLSLTQVLASALATVTATAALSLFGVAGTVIGAALASVLTVVGNHLYAQSIQRTQARVLASTAALRTRATVAVGESHTSSAADSPTVQDRQASGTAAAAAESAPHERRVLDLGSRKRLLLSSLAVFVAILAAVTAFEVLAGKPLTDVVRHQNASGTSLGGYQESTGSGTLRSGPSGSSDSSSTTSPTSSSSSTDHQSPASATSTGSQGSASSTSTSSSPSSASSTTTAPPTSKATTPATPTGASSSASATSAG